MFVKKFECKWICRKNLRTYGIIEKVKLDFSYTNLFVTIITTITVLIVIASIYKLEVHQMRYKNNILNGEINERNLYGLT